MIVGFVGFCGSGKDTCANYLVRCAGFTRETFAGPVKDCLAAVFGWDRDMLEGLTNESRQWREQVDEWWARELSIPNFSPRWAMQHWATDLVRDKFHSQTWLLSMKRRLQSMSTRNIVISDVRFPNEIEMIRASGGVVIHVRGASEPEWYDLAHRASLGSEESTSELERDFPKAHMSEWAWMTLLPFNETIVNDGSLDELFEKVNRVIERLE